MPVFFIHGLTGSIQFWEAAMYDEVRANHSWYSLSLPFHYPSSYDGKYDEKALHEDKFAALLDGMIRHILPGGKFILVGYSVGAFGALNYVAKYPTRVQSVVSVGGFMTGRAKGLEGVLQFFSEGRVLRKFLFWSSWKVLQSHVFFLRQAVKFYACKDKELQAYEPLKPTLQLMFSDVAQHDIEGMRAWFRYLLFMNLCDEIKDINCPVLAFAGSCDPIIPYQHQTEYAAALPNCRFVKLDGVGHVALAEAPEIFKRELVSWLTTDESVG